jgi:hypothetical protein
MTLRVDRDNVTCVEFGADAGRELREFEPVRGCGPERVRDRERPVGEGRLRGDDFDVGGPGA